MTRRTASRPAGRSEDRGDPHASLDPFLLVPSGLTYKSFRMSCAAHIAASGPVEGACLAREHAGEAPRAPKLIDVVRDALRARHYSRRTEKAYIGWIRRYILFHGKRHPRELGAAEATRF